MTLLSKRDVREIFSQAQHSVTSHEKLCKKLKQMLEKMDPQEFLKEFMECLKVPLVHGDKHLSVENTLNFAAKFSVSLLNAKTISPSTGSDDEDEEMSPFTLSVFNLMFEHHNTENQAIRFRVCQFVNKLLNSLGNEACIDDGLCDQISECMMERLQDKAPAVRVQAIMALHRLQDPYDPNCPVMKAFMFHMSTDPSADVRRAAMTNIAITPSSVRCIVERTHDVKDLVRRTAYMTLSKLSVQRFTIKQRVRLLTDGLKDYSEMVQNCVSKIMLPTWLQYYKGSFLALLHALDCESSTEISILSLQTLFKTESMTNIIDELSKLLNEEKVIPMDDLTPESVLYWRVLFEYLEAHPEIAESRPIDEPLPDIVPELTIFCNYVRQFYLERSSEEAEHWIKLQHQYILQQLLEMIKGFDLADEMGRSNSKNLCIDLLTSQHVSEDVVPVLIQVMVKVVPDVETRLQSLAEVISEVREPLAEETPMSAPTIPPEEARQRELKQASIRVKINELKEEQDEAIKEQDFFKAQRLKEEWQALQLDLEALSEPVNSNSTDPQPTVRDPAKNRVALCKCLRIVREMVQSESVKSLSATLRSLMQNFVLPCFQEDHSLIIRNKALEALGLFSLLDENLAKENFVMFCFQIANDEVCEVALKITFDLLLLFGLETFQVQEDGDGDQYNKKKSKKKKKKNLFVTDMYDTEFEDDDETQENTSQTSPSSSTNTADLISLLTSLLDSASVSMRNLAMEGLYKLLMACRITSSALLSRLLLMWYSPVTEGDEELRQPLGAFLTMYASHCPRSQETLEQAFLPTLRTLSQAPVTSPLTQVDQDSVARLILNLTRPGINKYHSKVTQVHNNMAISICNEILNSEEDATSFGVLLRALLALNLCYDDPVFCDELKILVKRVIEVFRFYKDKQNIRYLEKFYQAIESATNNSTMQTAEVENTAATDRLEATGSQVSINSTNASSKRLPGQEGSKQVQLLQMKPTPILRGDRESDDDDSFHGSTTEHSPIVIPPSPPQSQSSDSDDEELSKSSSKAPVSRDKTFKEPQPTGTGTRLKRGVDVQGIQKGRNSSKGVRARKISSSSESDPASQRVKRRKESQEEVNNQAFTGKQGRGRSHQVSNPSSCGSSGSVTPQTQSDSSPILFTRHGRQVKGAAAAGFARKPKGNPSPPKSLSKGEEYKKLSQNASSPSRRKANKTLEPSPARSRTSPSNSSKTALDSSPKVISKAPDSCSPDQSKSHQRRTRAQLLSDSDNSPPLKQKRIPIKGVTKTASVLPAPSPKSSDVTPHSRRTVKSLSDAPQEVSSSPTLSNERTESMSNLHRSPSKKTSIVQEEAKSSDCDSTPSVGARRSTRLNDTSEQQEISSKLTDMKASSKSSPSKSHSKAKNAESSPRKKGSDKVSSPEKEMAAQHKSGKIHSKSLRPVKPTVCLTRLVTDKENSSSSQTVKLSLPKASGNESHSLRVQAVLRSQGSPSKLTPPNTRSNKGSPSDSDSSASSMVRRSNRRHNSDSADSTNKPRLRKSSSPEKLPQQLLSKRPQIYCRSISADEVVLARQVSDVAQISSSQRELLKSSRRRKDSATSPGTTTESESPRPALKREVLRSKGKGRDGSTDVESSPSPARVAAVRVNRLRPEWSTESDSSIDRSQKSSRLRGKTRSSSDASPCTSVSTLAYTGSGLDASSEESDSPHLARRRSVRKEVARGVGSLEKKAKSPKASSESPSGVRALRVRGKGTSSENEGSPARPPKKLRSSSTSTQPTNKRQSRGRP